MAGITTDPANSSIVYSCSDMPNNDGILALQVTYSWFLRMCSVVNCNYIKMDLEEVGGGREDWMELAQDRDGWRALVGTVRNFRVP